MNECCKKEENLEVKEQTKDTVIRVCKECGLRHFELSVDPAKLGLVFK